uniref:helix-turn-helix transcriptional regulator n=1 Tax=Streptomyces sp. GSL17-111 TaxID=3121596 RepID=UPI0030F380E0
MTRAGSLSSRPAGPHGRDAELTDLHALLDGVRHGHGGALLLTAPPGCGRTTLLRYAARAFRPGPVVDVAGVLAERGWPHAGLHAVLSRAAALGLAAPPARWPGDRPAALELLRALRALTASAGPVLLCVDDAHHIDAASRSALGFAARRLGQGLAVGLVLTVERDAADAPEFAGLPVRHVGRLGRASCAALLDDLLPAGPDTGARERLLAEAGGVPGVLAELAALPGAAGPGAPAWEGPHPPGSLLGRYAARVRELPADTRTALLLAATDTLRRAAGPGAERSAGRDGAADGVRRWLGAVRAAGLDPVCLEPAEHAGLVRTGGGALRFDPPVVARLVYAGATLAARRAAHRLLADVGACGGWPLGALTPQQLRITRYVAEGATNREVSELLGVSPRTVDYHLRNVFTALGVRSRVELTRLVGRVERPEWAAF